MAVLTILTGENNPILRKKSVPVKKIGKIETKFVKNLEATLKEKNGLGLAAPQVGQNIRICIIRLNFKTDNETILALINPEITHFSKEMQIYEEGCLSLPEIFKKVKRPKEIEVKFLNKKGEKQILKLKDLNAVEAQHEIDHLDGILFIDKAEKE